MWRKNFPVFLLLTLAAIDPKVVMAETKGDMAVTPIKEFVLPEGLSSPNSLTVDPSGKVWFAEKLGKNLAVFDPEKEQFEVYPLPDSWGKIGPAMITLGPKGNVWFTVSKWAETETETETETDIIGRFNPAEGKFKNYKVAGTKPEELLVDAGGMVWFLTGDSLYRYEPEKPELERYAIPTSNSHPRGLKMDNAGNLWFVEANANKIAVYSQEKKIFGEVDIPTPFFNPSGLAVDNEGNVWFTGLSANKLSVFYPEKGIFNVVDIPTPRALPNRIALDGLESVWFLEYRGNKVGLFNPRLATFNEYVIPTFNSLPEGLTIDAERGFLWFSETATEARRLGRISIREVMAAGVAGVEEGKETGSDSPYMGLKLLAAAVIVLGALGAYMLYRRRFKALGRSRGG